MYSQQCIDSSFATITVSLQIFVVQNLHEIAENHKNVNFRVKNFCDRYIFFVITAMLRRPCAWTINSRCRSTHNSYTWHWLPLQRGCWRMVDKKKEVVWTKVLADLVGNFCSFSKSKHTETSLAANQHFVSDG